MVIVAKNVIITLAHRWAKRHAVKPCGAQKEASAGLAWDRVVLRALVAVQFFLQPDFDERLVGHIARIGRYLDAIE